MPGTMDRIAEIDQQLADLQSEDADRAAVDSIRDRLGSVKDYFRKTTDDISAAKDRIASELEAASEGSHTQPPEISAEEVEKFLDNVAEDDSGLDKWIEDATESMKGLVSDFSKAGNPTPEELNEEISGFEDEFSGEVKDWLKGAGKASGGLKKLLEDKRVKEFTDGVQGGLASSGNVLGGVTEGLEKVDSLLAWFQTVDDLTSDDAQTQLNALGEAFDGIVDSLGGSITLIPGLGAFFHLYGEAFRGAAASAATISASRDHYNDIFQTVDEGKYLYLTADARLQMKIAALEEERAKLLEEGLDAAYEERIARESADGSSGEVTFTSDYEVAVESAFRTASNYQPPLRSDAYIAWSNSSKQLDAAKGELEAATVNLDAARMELSQAEIAAEHAQDQGAAQGRIDMARGSVDRAEERFNSASAGHTDAAAAHRDATSRFRAENEAYNDVVRDHVIRHAAGTHGGRGFTEKEWAQFNRDYPQYEVTPAYLAALSASNETEEQDTGGGATSPVGAGAVIGGASASALSSKKDKRGLLIGAGAALGGLLLIGAIFVLPNLGSDGEIKAAETTSSTQASAPSENSDEPASDANTDVCAENARGCADYGTSIFASGSIVWEPGGSCPSTPTDVESTGINPSSTGWRVFVPGFGGCTLGDDGVTCPGEQRRGQRESNGVVTLLGETLEVTEVLDDGFGGVAEEWSASPDADGNPDMSTADCTRGGSFRFTTDPQSWQQAVASPIAESSPMSVNGFACFLMPTDTGVVMAWSMQVGVAVPQPSSPFQVSLEAGLGDWVTVATEVQGVIDPSGRLGMTTTGTDGSTRTPTSYLDFQAARADLAAFIEEIFGADVDPIDVIDELGLDPTDPEGALESLRNDALAAIFGAYSFDRNNSEEEAAALENYGPDTLVDAAGVLRNGRFAAFAPSNVCH